MSYNYNRIFEKFLESDDVEKILESILNNIGRDINLENLIENLQACYSVLDSSKNNWPSSLIFDRIADITLKILDKYEDSEVIRFSTKIIGLIFSRLSENRKAYILDILKRTIKQHRNENEKGYEINEETAPKVLSVDKVFILLDGILNAKGNIFTEEDNNILFQLLFQNALSCDERLGNRILCEYLPILGYNQCRLTFIWENCFDHSKEDLENNSSSIKSAAIDKVSSVLCSIADYLLPIGDDKLSLNLHDDPNFWKIILKGLNHERKLCRKKFLYLLKRITDSLNNYKIRCDCVDKTLGKIFWWNNEKKFEEIWYEFVLLYETLEETQVNYISS